MPRRYNKKIARYNYSKCMLKIRGETFIQQSSNTKLIKKSAIIELSTFTSIFFPSISNDLHINIKNHYRKVLVNVCEAVKFITQNLIIFILKEYESLDPF